MGAAPKPRVRVKAGRQAGVFGGSRYGGTSMAFDGGRHERRVDLLAELDVEGR